MANRIAKYRIFTKKFQKNPIMTLLSEDGSVVPGVLLDGLITLS